MRKQIRLAYKEAKRKRAARNTIASQFDPERRMTFERGRGPWDHVNKRVGAPKNKWTTEAVKPIWNDIRGAQSSPRTTQAYNPDSPGQEQIIRQKPPQGDKH